MSELENRKKNPLSKLISQVAQNSDSQITALVNARTDSLGNGTVFVDQNGQIKLSIELIDSNPYQPRKEFDELKIQELAESISVMGMIEPIVVRKSLQGRYELIAGERRLRAIKFLGRADIDVVIQNVSDSHMSIMALAENLDREDLSDYETGMAIVAIQEYFNNKTELADYLGRTKKDIHRLLAFNSFPQWVKDRLDLNPKLISKSISQSLKAFFESSDFSDKNHRDFVIKSLNALEEGNVTQAMLLEHIKRQIKKSTTNEHNNKFLVFRIYEHDGKEIGKFSYDNKKLSIKFNSLKIDEKLADEIYQIVGQKIKESLFFEE